MSDIYTAALSDWLEVKKEQSDKGTGVIRAGINLNLVDLCLASVMFVFFLATFILSSFALNTLKSKQQSVEIP